ncbi:hypothetical protein [Halostreptopolyspora alba]|uniref:Rpn family recombination-promoting nuclease/putative transposase n=1 Tax=Halostreptopolyspora alba TaxID=2487137 RepID=A0A3N0EGN7_9ACTN|nr:hypothetical protein EFW17_03710 [Nocardiopsaceae bacterium YIM 96095]
MPTFEHELLIELFRYQPSLAAVLLEEALDVEMPSYTRARVESGELTDCVPTEYRADAVVRLTTDDRDLAIVVEIQRDRDDAKRWSWPVYLATLRARLRCSATLLVLCPDDRTANWCAAPIHMGHPGWSLTPLVIGPKAVPVVATVERARQVPELALLSALFHSTDLDVLDTFAESLLTIEDEKAELYADYVLTALPEAAKRYLEDLMATDTYKYRSDFARRYYGRGKVEGEAESVVKILQRRGIPVPDEARERILSCADSDQLDTWLQRALTATSAEDLFD